MKQLLKLLEELHSICNLGRDSKFILIEKTKYLEFHKKWNKYILSLKGNSK